MKFETQSIGDVNCYNDALAFLKDAHAKGAINDIENMGELFDALDINLVIEYLQARLRVYHIDY